MQWYVWAILSVLCIVFEVASPTFFAGFIGIGFLGSALLSYFIPDSLNLQLLLALLGMFAGAFIFKRKKMGNTPSSKIGQSDEFIGMQGVVTDEVSHTLLGRVKLSSPVLGSTQWSALSLEETNLPSGTLVEIVSIHSRHLVVKPLT